MRKGKEMRKRRGKRRRKERKKERRERKEGKKNRERKRKIQIDRIFFKKWCQSGKLFFFVNVFLEGKF